MTAARTEPTPGNTAGSTTGSTTGRTAGPTAGCTAGTGPPGRTSPAWWLLVPLAVLVTARLLTEGVQGPAAHVVATTTGALILLVLPTWLCVRLLRGRSSTTLHAFLIGVGLGLVGLIVLALAVNTFLPMLGVDRPLEARYVVPAAVLATIPLILVQPPLRLLGVRRPVAAALGARAEWSTLLGLVAVVLAVAGAFRLNNGQAGTVALLSHVMAGVTLLALLVARGSLWRDARGTYLAALALVLSTALRGWTVVGHDILREYYTYTLAHDAGRWQMSVYQDAYNACLSVNLLPTALSNGLVLGGAVIFKVVASLFFALVPVVVLVLARYILDGRRSVMAAAVFISFPAYFNDTPWLVRQEYAYLFVALAFLVGYESRLGPVTKRVLLALMTLGVVLCHYSTTYLFIITIVAAWAGLRLTRWWRARAVRKGKRRAEPPVWDLGGVGLLTLPMIAVVLAATWLWTTPATHSGGHAADTVVASVKQLVFGGSLQGSSDLKYVPLIGQSASPADRLRDYDQQSRRLRASKPASTWMLDDADARTFQAHSVDDQGVTPLTPVARAVASTGVPVSTANAAIRAATAIAIQAVVLFGMLMIVVHRRWRRRFPDVASWLALGSMTGLAVVVLVPGLSAEYGVFRAFQQLLIAAAPVVVVGASVMVGWLRRAAVPALVLGLAAMYAVLSGVLAYAIGGAPGDYALNNRGVYYRDYHADDAMVAADRWVGQQVRRSRPAVPLATDYTYTARLQTDAGHGGQVGSEFYYPPVLLRGAWVVLQGDSYRQGYASTFFTGDLLTYRYPTRLLERRLDVVYAGPSGEVLR